MMQHNNLLSVRNLYESAFPPDERREFESLLDIADKKPAFRTEIYRNDAEILGFIFYWTFRDFVYIEHFAVEERFRSCGYGRNFLLKFCEKTSLPIVLEVEKPEDELSARRIRFYESLEFKLSDMPYLQPAYSENKKPVPMLLMFTKEICLKKAAEEIGREVYRQ